MQTRAGRSRFPLLLADLDRASGWRDAVVGLKPAILRAVLISVGPPWEIRGGLQLVFSHLGPIALELRVVVELVPGQSVVLCSEAEEALKGDDHEGDLPAHLFDNQALHLPDPMASDIVDHRAFDPVAFDIAPRGQG